MKTSFRIILIEILLVMVVMSSGYSMNIEESIVVKMFDKYQLDKEYYEIEVLSHRFSNIEIESDQISIRPMTEKDPIGLFTVAITVKQENQDVISSQVRLRIKRFAEVITVNDRIKRNKKISSDLLELQRKEITNLKEKPITDINEVLGLRFSRNLKRGQILTTASVETFPDVIRGREINIVYFVGLCKISALGVVLQEGRAGDYIKVKNKSSGKIIIARVVDNSAVAVDL